MRPRFDPWVQKIPWRRAWEPTPGFLPGESHGQRSLMGYSPWGHTESDTIGTTDRAHTYPSDHHVGQKSPEISFLPLSSQHPPTLRGGCWRFACSPPSYKPNHTVCPLLCLLPPSFPLTIMSVEKLLLRGLPWWLSGEAQ